MTANLEALESLLSELFELGAAQEEKQIASAPSLTLLIAKAQSLGLHIPSEASLDDLRSAVEEACERLKTGALAWKRRLVPSRRKKFWAIRRGFRAKAPNLRAKV